MAISATSSSKRAHRSLIYAMLATVLLVVGVITFFSGGSAFATNSTTCSLYASANGSDSNSGSASAPFATAKHLLEKLTAGQTGCLASGQTFAAFTLYAGNTHGAEGEPVTLTSTNPEEPATIAGRVVTETGANWLSFTHLNFIYGADTLYPAIGIGSAHTTWTYDNVSGGSLNICFETNYVGDPYGGGEYTLIEHDRVYACGHPVTKAELEAQANDVFEGRENGWHTHGLYNEGLRTTVKNSYFYGASGIGIFLRSGADAVIEHNVIDGNGRGVEFGNEAPETNVVAWNIVTNSASPCGKEVSSAYHCDSFGVQSTGEADEVGTGNVFSNNDVYGNEGGNIGPSSDLCSCVVLSANVAVNPLFANEETHEYAVGNAQVAGYGPEGGQLAVTPSAPSETVPPSTNTTEAGAVSPTNTEATSISPPATPEATSPSPSTIEAGAAHSPTRTETTTTSSSSRKQNSWHNPVSRGRGTATVASYHTHKAARHNAKYAKHHHRAHGSRHKSTNGLGHTSR